jgi:hypothetical protein
MSALMEIDGACLCGHVSYAARIDPAKVRICHCTQCQIQSASAFRTGVLVEKEHFRLLSGELKFFVKTAESGKPRALAFCPECGTSIYGAAPVDPTTYSLRLGTARQRAELEPTVQIWARSAMPWLNRIPRIPKVALQSGRPAVDDRAAAAHGDVDIPAHEASR